MDFPTAQEIARGLKKSKQIGRGKFVAICPAHDDSKPSLYITEGRTRVLFKCFSCSQESILDALRDLGLWPAKIDKTYKTYSQAAPAVPSDHEWDHALMLLSMVDDPYMLSYEDKLAYDRAMALYVGWSHYFEHFYYLHITDVEKEMLDWVKDNAECGLIDLLSRRGR